jgi:anti-sigma factor RsiW
MSCKELVELVTDYLEGTLPSEQQARFDAHIAECFWCARYLDQMRVTIATVGRIEEESLSPKARATLLAAFSDWSGGERPLREPPE